MQQRSNIYDFKKDSKNTNNHPEKNQKNKRNEKTDDQHYQSQRKKSVQEKKASIQISYKRKSKESQIKHAPKSSEIKNFIEIKIKDGMLIVNTEYYGGNFSWNPFIFLIIAAKFKLPVTILNHIFILISVSVFV